MGLLKGRCYFRDQPSVMKKRYSSAWKKEGWNENENSQWKAYTGANKSFNIVEQNYLLKSIRKGGIHTKDSLDWKIENVC